jgi:phage internal scaffolding protein
MIPIEPLVYDDGRTSQSFKDSTDINKLVYKHAKAGTLSHLAQYGAQYGDFSNFDFFEAQVQLARAREIFEALPAETRREFGNNPAAFFEFVGTRSNDELRTALPELAKAGKQMPQVIRGGAPAPASEPEASVPTTPAPPEATSGTGAVTPSEG